MQAAVGLAQLERFDTLLAARLRNAESYKNALPGKGKWLFVAETKDPVGLQKHLKENGVESRPVFTPLHRCPVFKAYAKGNYRGADKVWESGVCLPTGPHLKQEEQERIINLVARYIHESPGGADLRAA
jgi:perosamine synthetase